MELGKWCCYSVVECSGIKFPDIVCVEEFVKSICRKRNLTSMLKPQEKIIWVFNEMWFKGNSNVSHR